MILHGRDLLVYKVVSGSADRVVIAGAKSCEINISADTIEKCSPTSGQWREYVAGRKGWTLNVSYLVSTGELPSSKNMVGTIVTLKMTERTNGTPIQGTAIVQEWRVVGTLGNLATGAFKFVGSGALI